jgi:hypothetical protein
MEKGRARGVGIAPVRDYSHYGRTLMNLATIACNALNAGFVSYDTLIQDYGCVHISKHDPPLLVFRDGSYVTFGGHGEAVAESVEDMADILMGYVV